MEMNEFLALTPEKLKMEQQKVLSGYVASKLRSVADAIEKSDFAFIRQQLGKAGTGEVYITFEESGVGCDLEDIIKYLGGDDENDQSLSRL